ncbi:hypothetical protein P7C73_g3636, partial [Tremellales sp. Uapishka_1]
MQASSFASSSRVGLDFTLPRRSPEAPMKPSTAAPITPQFTLPGSAPSSSTSTPTPPSAPSSKKGGKAGQPPRFHAEPPRLTERALSPTHTLTVTSTRNNTLLTFSDGMGPLFPTITCGTDKKFKNAGKDSFEAAHQATLKMFGKIVEYTGLLPYVQLRVAFNGFGKGREAVSSALAGAEGDGVRKWVVRVEDRSRIKIGGTRARKPRRL